MKNGVGQPRAGIFTVSPGRNLSFPKVCADDDRVFETKLWQAKSHGCFRGNGAKSVFDSGQWTRAGTEFTSCLPVCLRAMSQERVPGQS